jgi:hypothetical protein
VKTWADVANVEPRGLSLDRDKGEGPPRCCDRRLVAADALICYDDLAAVRQLELLKRFPHLDGKTPVYLCDACADTLVRERIISHEDRALDFGLDAAVIARARARDAKVRS